MKNLAIFTIAVLFATACMSAMVGCNSSTPADADFVESTRDVSNQTPTLETHGNSVGIAAIQKAAEEDKYLFVLFHKEDDSQTDAMRDVLGNVMHEVADKAESVEVDVTASSETAIVEQFGVSRAPMPLLLALAPNGAITGGFPTEASRQDILDAFASPGAAACLKHLQESRLVFLCVQNEDTESNADALNGVREFKADSRFAEATEIVMLDPTDVSEASFLKDLEIDPNTGTAVTAFLVPPGMPVAKYEGATSKEELVATLEKASSACGPGGCGPSGCAP